MVTSSPLFYSTLYYVQEMERFKTVVNTSAQSKANAGRFAPNGGVVPPSLLQEKCIPRFYKEAITQCGAANPSQAPDTNLVYNLMIASCLPRSLLGNIWSLVNRTLPGQLTRQEFFSCLALMALSQRGLPLSTLSTMSSLPLPYIRACAPFSPLNGPSSQLSHGNSSKSSSNLSSMALESSKSTNIMPLSALNILSDIDFSQPVAASSSSNHKPPETEMICVIDNHLVINSKQNQFSEAISKVSTELLKPTKIDSSDKNGAYSLRLDRPTSKNAICAATIRNNSNLIRQKGQSYFSKGPNHCNWPSNVNDVVETREAECIYVWTRCLEEAIKIFAEADTVLPNSNNHLISEVSKTERFVNYLSALNEIRTMTLRLREMKEERLKEKADDLEKIDNIWIRLNKFRLSEKVEADYSEFAGMCYHKQCANLWINRIDSLLPRLSIIND